VPPNIIGSVDIYCCNNY